MKKRIVLALGGNALQKKGEATAEAQKKVAIEVNYRRSRQWPSSRQYPHSRRTSFY